MIVVRVAVVVADEQLVIRHVRLCECGKPAGHNSLCFVERVGLDQRMDLTDAEVKTRREHSDSRRRRVNEERRAARTRVSEYELVSQVREAELLLSTVAAANRETSSSESQRVGPSTQRVDDDPRWRLAKRQLRRSAEQLLDLAEEIRGHGIAAGATTQLGEHKDAAILECAGLKPREVVQHLGREVAGGSRTVERVREEHGDCRWCGREWPT
jgi:hypothetical protein